MRPVSVMPLWDWVSGMLMWHLGLEVNVTGDNGSGQRTGRTLIISAITSSSFLSPVLCEVCLNTTTARSLNNTHMPVLLYGVIQLSNWTDQWKEALHRHGNREILLNLCMYVSCSVFAEQYFHMQFFLLLFSMCTRTKNGHKHRRKQSPWHTEYSSTVCVCGWLLLLYANAVSTCLLAISKQPLQLNTWTSSAMRSASCMDRHFLSRL